jgi:dTDP-4-dehydrorhamnose reductase
VAASRKILVTGAAGLLGSEFSSMARHPTPSELEIIPKTHRELDITDPQSVEECLTHVRPNYVINCAGYTDVDGAETERERAESVNIHGVRRLAQACEARRIKLIHFSTNCIFDGEKPTPYLESDNFSPINFYGETKLKSEQAVKELMRISNYLILRITWPYGENGKNFINHAIGQIKKTPNTTFELKVVTDQIGSPTPALLLARKTLEIFERATGTFHLSCTGSCSKYELISFLIDQLKSPCRLVPARSADFPSPARRPKNSSLGTERMDLFRLLKLPPWQKALSQYISRLAR